MIALDSGSPDEIADVLVALSLHDHDGAWIEEVCWRMADHPDPSVRGIAGLCLGHVARRFGVVHERSWELVRLLCDDPTVDNRPCDALDDMMTFARPPFDTGSGHTTDH
jgi:hypothetical protein